MSWNVRFNQWDNNPSFNFRINCKFYENLRKVKNKNFVMSCFKVSCKVSYHTCIIVLLFFWKRYGIVMNKFTSKFDFTLRNDWLKNIRNLGTWILNGLNMMVYLSSKISVFTSVSVRSRRSCASFSKKGNLSITCQESDE